MKFFNIKIGDNVYNKTLFVHVPKTGGTSISDFLIKNNLDNWVRVCPVRHDPYFLLQKNNNIDDHTFTFSVVRNPYTRAYSYYHHFQRIHQIKLSFLQFLSLIRDKPKMNKTPWIIFSQNHFLHDSYGNCNIKKIYKFEHLDQFEYDFQCKLPSLNTGNYNINDYYNDYDENCISLVNYIYFKDFIMFNYSTKFLDSEINGKN
jgi:hypothetical protein